MQSFSELLKSFTIAVILFLPSSAIAHFNLNLNVRVIHVEHVNDGLNIYLRLPMPYLVAHLLGEAEEGELPEPAPYTYNRMEDGMLMHYVDTDQLQGSLDVLNGLALDGLVITVNGERLDTRVELINLYSNGTQPGFATLEQAKQALTSAASLDALAQGVYVGDTTVDILYHVTSSKAVNHFSISSQLNPGLPDQDQTANLVLNYPPGDTQVFRSRGLLNEPVDISYSSLESMTTFVKEGVRHILEGIDHVLFVICLVLGAMQLKPLLWRVTGFTVGHSITLSIGFFGFVPTASWFVPAVETGIALSILYVAVVAVLPDISSGFKSNKNEWTITGITALIGLLHGLGFSFVLQNILQVSSPNIWQSLLAFNIGVEIGQIAIVLFTLAVFYLAGFMGQRTTYAFRYLVAGTCSAISLFWVFERGASVISVL